MYDFHRFSFSAYNYGCAEITSLYTFAMRSIISVCVNVL